MSGKLQQVHVRVNDAATGKPTPCLISVHANCPDRVAPFGRLARIGDWCAAYEGNNLFGHYIDGACEIAVPPGAMHVSISKGPEYEDLWQELELPAGKLALRFTLKRIANLRDDGWYSGDIGAHELTPHGALLEGSGEDLAVVNLLAFERECIDKAPGTETGIALAQYPNLAAFSGQQPALAQSNAILTVNTLNQHRYLGQLALLHCHRPVFPLRFGPSWYAHGSYEDADWSLADWCDQCHRKKGLVVWFDGHDWGEYHRTGIDSEPAYWENWPGGEALADLILGRVDAINLSFDPHNRRNWYNLLNAGFAAPVVAGYSKNSATARLGWPRTYANIPMDQAFSYSAWIEAVRAGRTFVSCGKQCPLLRMTVNGQPPGAIVTVAGEVPVEITVSGERLGGTTIEIVANGEEIYSQRCDESPRSFAAEVEMLPDDSCWVAARCISDHQSEWVAHTSPVYVRLHGRPSTPNASAIKRLLAQLDASLRFIQDRAQTEPERLLGRVHRVFAEAKNALHTRLGNRGSRT